MPSRPPSRAATAPIWSPSWSSLRRRCPGRVRAEVGELVLDAWRKHAAVRAQAMADTVAAAGRAEGIDIEFRAVEGFRRSC